MLDHHPELAVANDSHFVPRALQKHSKQLYESACCGAPIPLSDKLVEEVWNYHRFYRMELERSDLDASASAASTYQELVSNLFELFAQRRGKSLAGEKTPDYVRHSDVLLGMFPASRMVHMVRDGRDTALSLLDWATPSKGPGRFQLWDEDPVAVSALWWREFVTCGPDSDRGDHHPDRWVTVKYEQLLDCPDETLHSLCEQLSLEYSDAMLRFHVGKQQGKVAEQNSAKLAEQSSNQSAKGRWLPVTRGLRDWRKSLPPEDVVVFESLAGDALEMHGYELSGYPQSSEAADRIAVALEFWNQEERSRRRPKAAAEQSEEAPCQESQSLAFHSKQPRIPDDAELPNLGTVLDSSEFEQFLAGHDIQAELQSNYLRYKPGTNCLVGFRNTITGMPWGFAIAHRADAGDKLENALRFVESRSVSGRPASGFVDEQRHIAAFCFPHDPRLPFLADGISNLTESPGTSFEVLSYKPQRRCVLKVTNVDGNRSVVRFYCEAEYVNSRKAYRQLAAQSQSSAGLASHSDRHCTITTPWHDGSRCLNGRSVGEKLSQLSMAGEWLGEFHQGINHKLPVVTPGDMLERLNVAIDALSELLPHERRRMVKVASRVAAALPLRVNRMVRSHGDFHAGQLVLDGSVAPGNLNAIDWDHACNAPVACDLGSFIAHYLLEHGATADTVEASQRDREIDAFLAGYERVVDQSLIPDRSQLACYVAIATLQVAIQPFRSCRPQWQEQAKLLVDYAERSLREVDSTVVDPDYKPVVENLRNDEDLAWVSQSLCPRGAGLEFSKHGIRLQTIRPIRSVTNRRCLVEYVLHNEDCVLGKARKKGLDLLAWQAQRQVFNAASRAESRLQRLRIAQLFGAIPDWNMWFQSRLSGDSINSQELLARDPDTVFGIGQALGELHQLNVQVERRHTIQNELEILESGMERVIEKRPNWTERIQTIQSACRDFLLKLSTDRETGIHRDFYPAQVVLDGDQVGIVDLDLFAMGHPAIDVGNFVAHLMEAAVRLSGKTNSAAAHSEAFVAGYQSTALPLPPLDIEIMTFVSFARHIQISHRISDRRKSTRQLIRKCHQLMEQLVRRTR